MKQVLLTGAALLMAASSAAFAATGPNDTTGSATMAPSPAQTTRTPAGTASQLSTADNSTTRGARGASTGTSMDSSAMFTTIPAQEDLTSKVVGLSVYNSANQNIGKIKDIAFDMNGVEAYIVAVGGFLGMGDHYVAVKPSAIDINYDANSKKWHAAMNTDANQLKAAPEYKYSSND